MGPLSLISPTPVASNPCFMQKTCKRASAASTRPVSPARMAVTWCRGVPTLLSVLFHSLSFSNWPVSQPVPTQLRNLRVILNLSLARQPSVQPQYISHLDSLLPCASTTWHHQFSTGRLLGLPNWSPCFPLYLLSTPLTSSRELCSECLTISYNSLPCP